MHLPKPVYKPAFNVTRASHLVSRVRDLEASRAFYCGLLGLVVSDEDSTTLWLRGLEEACHHSLVLKVGEPAVERVGMRVLTEEDLDLLQAHFAAAGFPTEWVEVAQRRDPREALRVASANRVRPITMTTLAAILTLMPLALAIGQGSGIQQPLAIAIIAGLLLQYPLVLLAMPVLIGLTLPGRPAGSGSAA